MSDKFSLTKSSFGSYLGRSVSLFVIKNSSGSELKLSEFGASVVSLRVPDRNGILGDVVLGYDTLDGYINDTYFLGVTVGRFANRIGGASFTIDGRSYQLDANEGDNLLHGGDEGFNRVVWSGSPFKEKNKAGVEFTYLSKDGDSGFPGNLNCSVKISLSEDDILEMDYRCSTDKTTVVNLTHHDYFNLKDGGASDVKGHELRINAKRITKVDGSNVPTGELYDISGSCYDFNEAALIGDKLLEGEHDLESARGFDVNYVLDPWDKTKAAAIVYEPESGRTMELVTDKPGMQFYTGNYLNRAHGKQRVSYNKYHGFCLETQHFPDSPNKNNFPSPILRAEETYCFKTQYMFGIRE